MSDDKPMSPQEIEALLKLSFGAPMTATDIENWIARKPDFIYKQPLRKAEPHKLVFRAVGKAGERKVIAEPPDCYFRGESIDAKDTLDGAGTVIQMLLVGKRLQSLNQIGEPLETRELMRAIREGYINFKMDTCQPALMICLAVLFKEDCEFRAEISGLAVKR